MSQEHETEKMVPDAPATCNNPKAWNVWYLARDGNSFGISKSIRKMAQELSFDDFLDWWGKRNFYDSCSEARRINRGSKK